jgi:hypothetical protein
MGARGGGDAVGARGGMGVKVATVRSACKIFASSASLIVLLLWGRERMVCSHRRSVAFVE